MLASSYCTNFHVVKFFQVYNVCIAIYPDFKQCIELLKVVFIWQILHSLCPLSWNIISWK